MEMMKRYAQKLLCISLATMLAVSCVMSRPAKSYAVPIAIAPVAITAAEAAKMVVTAVVGYAAADFALQEQPWYSDFPSLAKAIEELVQNGFTSVQALGQDAIAAIQNGVVAQSPEVDVPAGTISTAGMGTITGTLADGTAVKLRTCDLNTYAETRSNAYVELIKWNGSWTNGNGFYKNYLGAVRISDSKFWYTAEQSVLFGSSGFTFYTQSQPFIQPMGAKIVKQSGHYYFAADNTASSRWSMAGAVTNGVLAEQQEYNGYSYLTGTRNYDFYWTAAELGSGNFIINTGQLTSLNLEEYSYTAPATGYDASTAINNGMPASIAESLSDGDIEASSDAVFAAGGTIVANPGVAAGDDPVYSDTVTGQAVNSGALTADKAAFQDWVLQKVRTGELTIADAQAMINAWVVANEGTVVDSIGMTLEAALAFAGALVTGFEGWNLGNALGKLTNIFRAVFPFCLVMDFADGVQALSFGETMGSEFSVPLAAFGILGVSSWDFDLSPIITLAGYIKAALTAAWTVGLFVLTRKIFLKG